MAGRSWRPAYPEAVRQAGAITNGTIGKPKSIDIGGNLAGLASSASISASGASSSFGLTSIGGGTITAKLDYVNGPGSISQTVLNQNNATGVESHGEIISGGLTGTASSIQVAAVGSSASVAASSIAPSTTSFGAINLRAVTQISRNLAPVSNSGFVSAGMVSGLGSSIGISATGASASVSFSSIAGL